MSAFDIGTLDPEQVVLASIGYSSTTTPWEMYQALAGERELPGQDEAPLRQHLEASLLDYMQARYGAFVYEDHDRVGFTPQLSLRPIARLGAPGKLGFNDGVPFLIEMPSQEAYKTSWRDSSSTVIPFRVRARAQMRMKATGTTEAALWVCSDFGQVDEFHVLEVDGGLVSSLVGATNAMFERVARGEAPDPEDDDLAAAVELSIKRGNDAVRVLAEGEPLATVFEEYEKAVASLSLRRREEKAADGEVRELKNAILREMEHTPTIKLPSGRIASPTVVRTPPKSSKGSSWVRLDITKLPAG